MPIVSTDITAVIVLLGKLNRQREIFSDALVEIALQDPPSSKGCGEHCGCVGCIARQALKEADRASL